MKCPFCKVDDDRVVDSRASNDGFAIRRRRECVACDRRYTTYERIEESPLRVVKKDERREPFERRKILLGLIKACEKRPIPIARLEEITERIENRILERYETEVPVTYIGELVMDELKTLDQIAYVRFASVYREFKDITEFMEELKPLLAERSLPPQGPDGRPSVDGRGTGARGIGGRGTGGRSKRRK
jgi:transcriptional repressor NrdR